MSAIASLRSRRGAAGLALGPLNPVSLRDQAYARIKEGIANTDIYRDRQVLRLDERELMPAYA